MLALIFFALTELVKHLVISLRMCIGCWDGHSGIAGRADTADSRYKRTLWTKKLVAYMAKLLLSRVNCIENARMGPKIRSLVSREYRGLLFRESTVLRSKCRGKKEKECVFVCV